MEILETVSRLAIISIPLFLFALKVLIILKFFDKILNMCKVLKIILINLVSFETYYVIF